MNIDTQQRQLLIAALGEQLEKVRQTRKRDAEDMSSKWNDAREAAARRLDKERDELQLLFDGLSRPSGQIIW